MRGRQTLKLLGFSCSLLESWLGMRRHPQISDGVIVGRRRRGHSRHRNPVRMACRRRSRSGRAAGTAGLPTLAAGFPGFFGCKLVCRAAGVRRFAALPAGNSGFFRGEFVSASLSVGSLAALACDLAALGGVHGCEAASALASHRATPLVAGIVRCCSRATSPLAVRSGVRSCPDPGCPLGRHLNRYATTVPNGRGGVT